MSSFVLAMSADPPASDVADMATKLRLLTHCGCGETFRP